MYASFHNELDALEEAVRRLDGTESLPDVKAIRDKAEATRSYAKAAGLGLSVQNRTAVVKLLAERKAGRLLASLKLRGGDRRSKDRTAQLTLADLGVSRSQSRRWQQLALIAENDFCEYLAAVHAQARAVTTAGLLRTTRREGVLRGCAASPMNDDIGGSVARPSALEPVACELADHLRLLNEILRPVRDNGDLNLAHAERRLASRLITEMGALIQQLPNHYA
jgi:hypothetical protein